MEFNHIVGQVSSVRALSPAKDAPRAIGVVSSSSGKEYVIICNFFCPTRKGDVISGYCVKNKDEFVFVQTPLVEPPSSREAIQTAFIVALGKLRMNQWLSDKVYDFFERETIKRIDQVKESHQVSTSDSAIYRNRDILNAATMETISWYAFNFRTNADLAIPLINVGMTDEQVKKLFLWWYREQLLRRLYLLGLTKKEIEECCARGWPGGEQISVWENNPSNLYYQLLENPYLVEKLPMEKAQNICQRYELSFDQSMTQSAEIVRYLDKQCQENGWACYPVYLLMKKFPQYYQLEETLKKYYRCELRYNFIYLRYQAQVEDTLVSLLQPKEFHPKTHVSDASKKKLCEEQIIGLEIALNNTVSILTGSGGTGKTSCIATLCKELALRDITYSILSFTGKAVAKVKEVTNETTTVMTLHMLLARGVRIPPEYVIFDETSMIPNELMAKVLTKLSQIQPTGRKLKIVMVGDPNQVQPIEWGDFFNQVLTVGRDVIPWTHLSIDHRRTSKDGSLYRNTYQFANQIEGEDIIFEWGNDCQFVQGQLPQLESILRGLTQNHQDITIVSPYKELDDINELCQSIFIPKDAPFIVDSFGKTWKVGARVMITEKNFYDQGVVNGDEGIIKEVSAPHQYVRVLFNNGKDIKIPTFVPYVNEESDERTDPFCTKYLVLSWAITIHKSQGSEWPVVIFFLRAGKNASSFFNKKLLYTGISRAKDELYVVANAKTTFESAIYVNPPLRYDNLSKRLRKEPFVNKYVDPAAEKTKQLLGF